MAEHSKQKADNEIQVSVNKKSVMKKAINLFTFQEPQERDRFVLTGTAENSPQPNFSWNATDYGKRTEEQEDKEGRKGNLKHPRRVKRTMPLDSGERSRDEDRLNLAKLLVDPQLSINKHYIEEIFSLPKNKDIVIREFVISLKEPVRAFAVFMEGLTDRATINEIVLRPLMLLSKFEEKVNILDITEYIKDRILFGNQVEVGQKYSDIIEKINYGSTAIFIEGSPDCLTVETKGWDKRSISTPEVEKVIRGPHEAFNETLRSNTGLIRKALRNHNLITEIEKIGERNKTDVAIMYLEDVANPSLIQEVKRRISSIKSDYVGETGILEQFIEDHPFMAAPQILATERPDRVVSFLIDGKVAIFMDGNPNALIVPATIFSLLHTPEDYYLRLPYGNIVRLLRVVAAFIAIITPGTYISITNFHQEMIPTDLILSIAAAREAVPFPTIVEVIIMEFFFELIREAGVRVPGVIGNTLGIVGALILGQAAVEAGIVSPILIIVVAVTGLASFAIPNYSMSFAFRGARFVFIGLAAVFGFFGVTAGLFLLLISLASMKSFGVPLLSPIGPRTKTGPDVVLRGPVWSMEIRPDYVDSLDRKKQPRISRGWMKKDKRQKRKEGG